MTMNDLHRPSRHDHANPDAAPERAVDPICGMTVAADSPRRFDFGGTTYLFCSDHCLKKFSADPGKYAVKPDLPAHADDRASHGSEAASAGVIYTCPMHPEIRQEGPGVCPKCGMALEPEMPSAEADESPELRDFSRRFWWTLPLTGAAFILAMFGDFLFPAFPAAARSWTELVLATPVVLWAGWPFFERCIASIRTRNPHMWT